MAKSVVASLDRLVPVVVVIQAERLLRTQWQSGDICALLFKYSRCFLSLVFCELPTTVTMLSCYVDVSGAIAKPRDIFVWPTIISFVCLGVIGDRLCVRS